MTHVLCRGGPIVERHPNETDAPPFIHRAHHKLPMGPVRPGDMLEGWVEIFKLNPRFHCPACDSVFYNSQNYMEAPEWLTFHW